MRPFVKILWPCTYFMYSPASLRLLGTDIIHRVRKKCNYTVARHFIECWPARRCASAVLPVIVVSVSPSVTRRYCTKMAKRRITQTTLYDSPGTLIFWRQQSLVSDAPFLLKFALKMTHPPFEHNDFDQYPLIVPQPWDKCSVSTNRKSTTRFPTSHG